jgi:transposase InsO family protein
MISVPDRREAVLLIDEAVQAGARCAPACRTLGLSVRTYQRWLRDGEVKADGRPLAVRPEPANKLTAAEREQVLALCHAPEFASLPPSQIVPRLADQGTYLASESSFYRILRAAGEQQHRGRSRAPRPATLPPSHCAQRPCAVWTWDITWLPGPVRGQFFYLYLILDLYSRKIVGWEIHERETAELAAQLVRRAVLAEQCVGQPLVLHADNGSPQKGSTLRATLEALGIAPSYSRPRVSDDNPFSESLFRTCKYRPSYPTRGFESLTAARQWTLDFVRWYNQEHRHSALRYVTPAERHAGQDKTLLAARHKVYHTARAQHPRRWTGATRNWQPIGEVWLNPVKEPSKTSAPLPKAA